MEGHLMMSAKERKRKSVFDRVGKELKLADAAVLLGISYRQCKRSYKRYLEEGDRGLAHRSRGGASNRGTPAALKEHIVTYYTQRLEGFGPTLAAEKLADQGLEVDHETLRRWLLQAGLWQIRRKRREHRSRRERRAHFGELVQMDGSPHRWFGNEAPEHCLMELVDDATGNTLSLMDTAETTALAMRTLWWWIDRFGVPRALYTDKKNIFVSDRQPTLEEQLAGEEPLTPFGKICQKLGIEIIAANSPQAKGRVERKHGVYQDRFLKELKLQGVTTIEGANALLRGGFCDALNRKFAVPPREEADYHQPVPKGVDLADIFAYEQTRRVTNDWTVCYQSQVFQILAENRPLPKPKDRVIIRTRLDGVMQFIYKGNAIHFKAIPVQTTKRTAAPKPETPAAKPKAKRTPPSARTWRPNCTRRLAAIAQSETP